MNKVTPEYIKQKSGHELTMKNLREFVNKNTDLSDDTPVLIERITDFYFEARIHAGKEIKGWPVLLNEGWIWHEQKNFIESLKQDIERRKTGQESDYPDLENPEQIIKDFEDNEDSFKEQFHTGWDIQRDKNNDLVLIYSHY